jgi:hypothetical protein
MRLHKSCSSANLDTASFALDGEKELTDQSSFAVTALIREALVKKSFGSSGYYVIENGVKLVVWISEPHLELVKVSPIIDPKLPEKCVLETHFVHCLPKLI